MKGEYATDRQWADQYLPEIKALIVPVVRERALISATIADVWIDTKQATDLICGIVAQKVSFAARVRRPGIFWGRSFNSSIPWALQFTIRSRRDSGAETELAKIKRGSPELYFYGHGS